jgi:hypothetical protein
MKSEVEEESTSIPINVGDIFITTNLQTSAYNDKRVKVIGEISEKGRYPVTVFLDNLQEKKILLKPENLRKMTSQEQQKQQKKTNILIKDLIVRKVHENQILQGVISEEPFKLNAIQLILRDAEGSTIHVSVYNYPGYGGKFQIGTGHPTNDLATNLFKRGQTIAIRNPYCKIAMDGRVAIRVEDFSTISIIQ